MFRESASDAILEVPRTYQSYGRKQKGSPKFYRVDLRGFEELIFIKKWCFWRFLRVKSHSGFKKYPKQNRAIALNCVILRALFSRENFQYCLENVVVLRRSQNFNKTQENRIFHFLRFSLKNTKIWTLFWSFLGDDAFCGENKKTPRLR